MRKSTGRMIRNIFLVVLAVGLAVFAVSYIAKRTNGLKDDITWDKLTSKIRNDANIIDPADYALTTYNTGNGVKVVANPDGSVTINGELLGDENVTIEIGDVSFEADETYTFSTGWANASLYTAYMKVTYTGGYTNADFGDDIEFASATEGVIYLVITPEVKFNNVTLYPVINEGTTAVEFYK